MKVEVLWNETWFIHQRKRCTLTRGTSDCKKPSEGTRSRTMEMVKIYILHLCVSDTSTDIALMAENIQVNITQPNAWRNRKAKGTNGLGSLGFINIYFISSNRLIIINIIIFIFVSSQTNLIDRILCPCYYMIQLALISSHFTYFLLTDCTTYWCSLISICNVISQEQNVVIVSLKLSHLSFWLS